MTREQALAKLQVYAQWQVHPRLTLDELNVCLDDAQRTAESWDLNQAARDAWLLKAGKATDHHTSTIAGRRFEANQVNANCLAQAKVYGKRILGTIPIAAETE